MKKQYMLGFTSGRLTVIKDLGMKQKGKYKKRFLLVKCKCGTEKEVSASSVMYTGIKSCGCLKSEINRKKAFIDITGQQYSKLTVLSLTKKRRGRSHIWLCKCSCGNTVEVCVNELKNGDTKSCGCLPRGKITHGLTKTRIYRIYIGMKNRCYNPNNPKFNLWGGRGITICNEWLNSVEVFYEWANKNGYSDLLTIDRIDTDGNYEPNNCRWSTAKEQANNTRRNKCQKEKIKY